jgi:hypothetical protein
MDERSFIHNTGSIIQQDAISNTNELIADVLRPEHKIRKNYEQIGKLTREKISPSGTYAVRPSQQFMDENDPLCLEKLFPDYFPFCRGGPNEKRKKRISWKAYVTYILNPNRSPFDNAEFVFAVYNIGVRKEMATKSYIRAKLPSKHTDSKGQSCQRGAAYTRVLEEDLKQLLNYKDKCAQASKKGLKWPNAPNEFEWSSARLLHRRAAMYGTNSIFEICGAT